MSHLSAFLKKNKIQKENKKYVTTQSIVNDKGEPMEWEFRHLTTQEDETIRNQYTKEVPITGKPNMYRQKLDTNGYLAAMICACCIFPNLYDASLQDSYGVKTPESLLKALVDEPGEYNELAVFIQQMNGFNTSMEEAVEEAKN